MSRPGDDLLTYSFAFLLIAHQKRRGRIRWICRIRDGDQVDRPDGEIASSRAVSGTLLSILSRQKAEGEQRLSCQPTKRLE
jgi:hypothetical protein